MFNINIVHRSLKLVRVREFLPNSFNQEPADGEDKEISCLINDIFGGEILKTPQNKGWHFYNKVNGDRLDFSNPIMVELTTNSPFKDIPSNQKELYQFIDPNDYYTFYISFVMAYEEILGLKFNSNNDSWIETIPVHLKKYGYEITHKNLKPIKVQPTNALSLAFTQK